MLVAAGVRPLDREAPPGHGQAGRVRRRAPATGLNHAVLFWLETPGREASLRTRLAVHPAVASGALTVATAGGGTTQHPAGPVWTPLGTSGRVRLAQLSHPPGA
jgi:hypothetical protein